MACSCSVLRHSSAAFELAENRAARQRHRGIVRASASNRKGGATLSEKAGWAPLWPGALPDFHLVGDLEQQQQQNAGNRGRVAVEAPPPPPNQKKDDKKSKDYHVNVGYAIRSLRDELPGLFYKEPTFDIYREDIVFSDPLISFQGVRKYRLMFWGLRFYGRIFFRAIWVEVQRIWQPRDGVIMVRWSVRGVPRVPWEARGHFDCTSEYRLDSHGLIYAHKVDNLLLNTPPPYKPPAVLDLMAAAAGGRPAAPSPFFHSSWLRLYLALLTTFLLLAPSGAAAAAAALVV